LKRLFLKGLQSFVPREKIYMIPYREQLEDTDEFNEKERARKQM
jgi:hypothetical protein